MSNVRGIGGLVLATAFGVANGIAIFGPAFKEQKQQSADTDGEVETSASPMDAATEKIPEATTAIEPSGESATPQSPSKNQSLGLTWPSFLTKGSWNEFWREGDRALNRTARIDCSQSDTPPTRSLDQVKERGVDPLNSRP